MGRNLRGAASSFRDKLGMEELAGGVVLGLCADGAERRRAGGQGRKHRRGWKVAPEQREGQIHA